MKPAFASLTLAALIMIGVTGSAFARHGWDSWGWAQPHAHATKPSMSYAGDCGPNPPPGYRYDLKDWRSGFTDRDFSCYILEQD